MSVNVAIVYHSGYGHTKVVAEAVHKGADSVDGATSHLMSVDEVDWDTLDAADAIIFGSPTYMGSMSAGFAEFKDETSKRWFEQKWKDKLAGGFTNSGSWSGDKLNTLIQFATLAAQHGMIWVSLGQMPGNNNSEGSPNDLNAVGAYFGPMAQSNNDQGPDEAPIESHQETARLYGVRMAEAALRWNK